MAIYSWPLWIWQFKNQFPYMAILWYGMAIYGNTPLIYILYYIIYTTILQGCISIYGYGTIMAIHIYGTIYGHIFMAIMDMAI